MKPFTLPAMIVLALSLAPGCAPDDAPAAPTALVEGRWTLRSADAISTSPQRAVVGANLTLADDHTWRLRYDYHLASTPAEHIWSSGLSGTWEAQPGDPPALRFRVLDDGSTAVATVPAAGRIEVTLAGVHMRFERTPE